MSALFVTTQLQASHNCADLYRKALKEIRSSESDSWEYQNLGWSFLDFAKYGDNDLDPPLIPNKPRPKQSQNRVFLAKQEYQNLLSERAKIDLKGSRDAFYDFLDTTEEIFFNLGLYLEESGVKAYSTYRPTNIGDLDMIILSSEGPHYINRLTRMLIDKHNIGISIFGNNLVITQQYIQLPVNFFNSPNPRQKFTKLVLDFLAKAETEATVYTHPFKSPRLVDLKNGSRKLFDWKKVKDKLIRVVSRSSKSESSLVGFENFSTSFQKYRHLEEFTASYDKHEVMEYMNYHLEDHHKRGAGGYYVGLRTGDKWFNIFPIDEKPTYETIVRHTRKVVGKHMRKHLHENGIKDVEFFVTKLGDNENPISRAELIDLYGLQNVVEMAARNILDENINLKINLMKTVESDDGQFAVIELVFPDVYF